MSAMLWVSFPLLCIFYQFGLPLVRGIPIYWINLDDKEGRKHAMERHFQDIGVTYHKRIAARTPDTCNLIMVDSNCDRVSLTDLAITCSHLYALYTALRDEADASIKKSRYVLVMEDDVRFQFDIDIEKLISSAPSGFGALQLMMSSKGDIDRAWEYYSSGTGGSGLFTRRYANSTIWSAQAVIYNKDVIRPIISRIVIDTGRDSISGNTVGGNKNTVDKMGSSLAYKIVTAATTDINAYRPAVGSSCAVADMYMYALAQPAYILNVPLWNSAPSGVNSTYHQTHVPYHIQGFARIQDIQQHMLSQYQAQQRGSMSRELLLPAFAKPLQQQQPIIRSRTGVITTGTGSTTGGSIQNSDVNWTDLASKYPVDGKFRSI